MTAQPNRTALIIGASRGLGLALAEELLARGWSVIATARGPKHTALHDKAAASQARLSVEQLEMTDPDAVKGLRERLAGKNLDLLFVNAGVSNGPDERLDQVSAEEFTRIMVTNALGPMRIIEAFDDLVRPGGTIGVMSSGLGSVSRNETGGWEVYRASKAAFNTLMRSYAARTATDPATEHGRSLVIMTPGWVRTDMGGPAAPLNISESIPRVADVLESIAGKKGLRFLDYKGDTVAW